MTTEATKTQNTPEYYWVKYRSGSWAIAEKRHLNRWFVCGVGHIMNRVTLEYYRMPKSWSDIVEVGDRILFPHGDGSECESCGGVPDRVLPFDREAVYQNLTDRAKMFVSPEAVAEVLDAVERSVVEDDDCMKCERCDTENKCPVVEK